VVGYIQYVHCRKINNLFVRVLETGRNSIRFRVKISFTNNVSILCLFSNVKKSEDNFTAKLSEKSRNKSFLVAFSGVLYHILAYNYYRLPYMNKVPANNYYLLSYMNKVPAYNYYRLSYMNKVPEQLSFGQWPYIAKYYHIRIKCHAPYMWKTYWSRF
jgi:hypothetical protein